MSPAVVLIGPPGAGKSSVARLLADRLGLPSRDIDADVERGAGRTISDIFVDDGEATFRELEHAAVLDALAGFDGVLAVGGGAVLDPRSQQALAGHRVVFLDVRITDAARRIGLNRDRPLLIGNPRAQWTMMMDARRPVYQQLAGARVATDGLELTQVVDAVAEALAELDRSEATR